MDYRTGQHRLIKDTYKLLFEIEIDNINQIPPRVLNFLLLFNYKELAAPFARSLMKKGKSAIVIQRRFNLTDNELRTIGANLNARKTRRKKK